MPCQVSYAGPAVARTRVSSHIGMDESFEDWEEFAWCHICKRSVVTLAVAGVVLEVQLSAAVRSYRHNTDLIGLLGSQDVLSVIMFEAAGIARSLHNAAAAAAAAPAVAATQ